MTRRPEPGSPWERHCPVAFPREWLDGARQLPAGFVRPASTYEADLITGRMTEAEFLRRTGKAAPPSPAAPGKKTRKGKPPPVLRKLAGWNRFLDGLAGREPRLHPLAVAVWCWLWKCERDGSALASERRLAERFGVGRDNLRARLRELLDEGFLVVIQKGVHGRSATEYRVRPTPKKPTSTTELNG
ncbi:GntR family transcriptional regulator [Fimbriiglobus ruber]|uniref:Uncharacterized protein n=1 Tax=Fimbriiglobus ruber TaxID=1908690 RepID=A0A225D3K6_9BACT|nr:GntR family transcriptional regulator [Fimbriiglobus ruber]OWK35543.1 hypothetical protein FRUB_08106 [Fimbriiglobus ruber]